VLVLGLGLALSGLLEIDPNRNYGVLSDIARVLHQIVPARAATK